MPGVQPVFPRFRRFTGNARVDSALYTITNDPYRAALATTWPFVLSAAWGLFLATARGTVGLVRALPLWVDGLQSAVASRPWLIFVFILCLIVLSAAIVALSQFRPLAFGILEAGAGLGIAIFGFKDAHGYNAVFALIGGVLTMVDGGQRILARIRARESADAAS